VLITSRNEERRRLERQSEPSRAEASVRSSAHAAHRLCGSSGLGQPTPDAGGPERQAGAGGPVHSRARPMPPQRHQGVAPQLPKAVGRSGLGSGLRAMAISPALGCRMMAGSMRNRRFLDRVHGAEPSRILFEHTGIGCSCWSRTHSNRPGQPARGQDLNHLCRWPWPVSLARSSVDRLAGMSLPDVSAPKASTWSTFTPPRSLQQNPASIAQVWC